MTTLSCCIAGILAFSNAPQHFDLPIFCLVLVGLLLAHATNNLLNDFTDWHRGIDRDNYFRNRYGTHPMTVMTYNEMLSYLVGTGFCALACGILLIYLRGMIVFYLTLAGSFFLLFYTWPLKGMGLGEISVFLVWGILMIGGGYYTMTQQWSWEVCFASIPYSLGVTAVIMGKHIDKLEEDKKKGVLTLPVLIGESNSRYVVLSMFVLQYIITFGLVYIGFFSKWMLCTIASVINLPAVFRIYSKPRPSAAPAWFPGEVWPLFFVATSFKQNAIFGSLFLIGLVIGAL